MSDTSESRRITANRSVLASVALLYYKDGLMQSEIAKRLNISRATVVNYLKQARELQIVDIRVDGKAFASSNLSREVKDKFKLEDVYIAEPFAPKGSSKMSRKEVNRQIAQVGAMALVNLVQPQNTLGVAWGETIHFLSEQLPRSGVPSVTVCQLIGSMKSPLVSASESCAVRIASRLGAECHTLHSPAILSTGSLAQALREEPVIKSQLGRLENLSMALFSVGNCQANTHIQQTGMVNADELEWYRSKGAVGVLCARFIDGGGNPVVGEPDSRMIGIELEQLHKCKTGILVAGGADKREAITASIKGGYVTHLVIDRQTATQLLKED